MAVWIHRIDSLLPEFSFTQEEASAKMQEWARDERERRLIRAIYRNSGIERRHAVIKNYDGDAPDSFFRAAPDGSMKGPGTAARNAIYASESRHLSVALARKTLDNCPGVDAGDVTHVVTVSCTGFYNPGPDYYIVRDLGMSLGTERYHLGFMGCYAAFPALRMAVRFCEADPGAVVLVQCLELCSLHLKLSGTEDMILANSLFSDGAAAAIVSAREPAPDQNAYRIGGFHSTLVPGGEQDMAWRIGDNGFDIALSSYVPKIIGANLREFIEPSLSVTGLSIADVDRWAIHPGGKSVIDQAQRCLSLRPEQVRESREVLRKYGNMSSVSILFVLAEILERQGEAGEETVCAVAFGPGLTVEMALLSVLRAASGIPGGRTGRQRSAVKV
ncbi:MAG: type III polyketide synthase [Thermodesulfobacteriota bacterium]|nr:type III polyketide synthase [Thermodesulfobacteriota bacterium]